MKLYQKSIWSLLVLLGCNLVSSLAQAQYRRGGWGYPPYYPPCYSCNIIIGPDNPLRRHGGEDSHRNNAPLEGGSGNIYNAALKDDAAVNTLRFAGANDVFRVNYSCQNFVGQDWFNRNQLVFVDLGANRQRGGGDDAIWTCAGDDGYVLYKAFCPSGTARGSGDGCE